MYDIIFFICVIIVSLFLLSTEWKVRFRFLLTELLFGLSTWLVPLYLMVYSIIELYKIAQL